MLARIGPSNDFTIGPAIGPRPVLSRPFTSCCRPLIPDRVTVMLTKPNSPCVCPGVSLHEPPAAAACWLVKVMVLEPLLSRVTSVGPEGAIAPVSDQVAGRSAPLSRSEEH